MANMNQLREPAIVDAGCRLQGCNNAHQRHLSIDAAHPHSARGHEEKRSHFSALAAAVHVERDLNLRTSIIGPLIYRPAPPLRTTRSPTHETFPCPSSRAARARR